MHKVIERLEFQAKLDRYLLIDGKSFEEIFENEEILLGFGDFIITPQGKKWLTSKTGKLYNIWQRS